MLIQIAWRYFWSKKNTKAIHIISWVSIVAIAISVAAILVVLSGFNGIEHFIKSRYSSFYPQVKIVASKNKEFSIDDKLIQQLQSNKDIAHYSFTLEQNALLEYEGVQSIITVKGVDSNYESVAKFDQYITYGSNLLFKENNNIANSFNNQQTLIAGIGVSNTLGTSEQSLLPLNMYVFKNDATIGLDPTSAYNSAQFNIGGIFNIQDEINTNYCFAHLQILQSLAEKYDRASAIELLLKPNKNDYDFIDQWNKQNTTLVAQDRLSQNKTLYFVLKSEKWMIWAILTLILIIACFNLISTLSMLVIDKQRDLAILKTLGNTNADTIKIITYTGLINGGIGTCIGIILALVICFIQQRFKLLKMGNAQETLLDAYPIKIVLSDYLITILVVIIVLIISSLLPAIKVNRKGIVEAIKQQ